MKIKVFYDREKSEKTIEVGNGSNVHDLLEKMKINHEIVIVSRNNDIILKEEKLKENDSIRLTSVISGG